MASQFRPSAKAAIVGGIAGVLGLFGLVAATNHTTTPLQETPVPQQGQAVQGVTTVNPTPVPAAQEQPAAQPTPVAPAPTPAPASGNGYTNVDGNYVPSPSNDPAGASAQCSDGTYSYSQNRRGTCSHHGGVARWL